MKINYVVSEVVIKMIKQRLQVKGANILVLGITFKENCPDIRNSKVVDAVKALKEYDTNVTIYDPWANPAEVEHEYGVTLSNTKPTSKYDAVILAVSHKEFETLDFAKYCLQNTVIFDVKAVINVQWVDGRL